MSPIRIDLSGLFPPRLLAIADHPQDLANSALRAIAESAAANWRKVASNELHATAQTYRAGIQEPSYDSARPVARIELVGMLPNMIEQGWDGGDMRQWLCGPNAENRKPIMGDDGKTIVGWYNTIPFRHAGPGTDWTVGAPMGSQYDAPGALSRRGFPDEAYSLAQQKLFGRGIHKEAKQLSATTTTYIPGQPRKTQWGGRLDTAALRERGWNIPKIKESHKTDPFAGMVRQEKTYEHATQSQYTTFRRISTRVAVGWIHPGISARNFVDRVRDHVAKIAPGAFRVAFRAVA